jgi:hypothetical protein
MEIAIKKRAITRKESAEQFSEYVRFPVSTKRNTPASHNRINAHPLNCEPAILIISRQDC